MKIPETPDSQFTEFTSHIVSHANSLVVGIKPDGSTTFVNRAVCECTGYSADELLNKNWWHRFYPGAEYAQVERLFREFEKGPVVNYEMVLTTKDGGKRTVSWNSVNRHDATGNLVEVIGLGADITDKLKQLSDFRENKLLTDRVQAVAHIGLFSSDLGPEPKFSCSAEVYRIFGIQKESLVHTFEGMQKLFHPDDVEKIRRAKAAAIAEEAPFNIDYRLIRPGGEVRWISAQADLIKDADGRPVRLIGLVQDITERKSNEAKLLHGRRFLDSVIDNLPLAVFAKAASSLHFTLWNKTAEKWYGLTKEQVIGKSDDDFFPAEQAEFFKAKDRETLSLQKLVDIPEEPITTKSGQQLFLHTRKIPITDDNGIPEYLLGVSDDITDRKSAEAKFKVTEAQLFQVQKLESIGHLAGGIAHDFNNLLTSILGYSKMLQRELKENPEIDRKLRSIVTSAERGAKLTGQLLAFARKGQYQKTSIDLTKLIQEVVNVLEGTTAKQIKIEIMLEGNVPAIIGDPTQIFQIFMNLGVNARDAMPQGGVLTFAVERFFGNVKSAADEAELPEGHYVRVRVRDTGCGIPRAIQSKVFDPFFTTKEEQKGTGLGLSVVYGIVQNHQGTITLFSEENWGTEFILNFPAHLNDAPEQTEAEISNVVAAHKPLAGKRILLVDDEEILRELGTDFLQPMGAKLLLAENGPKAIEIFRASHEAIDTVLLDVGMPGMDGVAVYHEIRKISRAHRVVFITGFTNHKEIAQLRNHDPNVDLILKPYSRDSLIAACLSSH